MGSKMIVCSQVLKFFICFLDLIKDIRDPEKPETLEQLSVVYEDGVVVTPLNRDSCLIKIEFIPTIPHCSLATMIGKE